MVVKGKVTKKKRTVKPPALPKKTSKVVDTTKKTTTNKTVTTTTKSTLEKKVEAKTLLKEYVLRPPWGTDTYYSVDVFETLEPESEVDKSEANKSTDSTSTTNSGESSTNTSNTSTATDSSSTSTSSGSTNSTNTTLPGVSTNTTGTDTTSTEDTEEESDDEGFTLHTGKILKTHTYKKMYDIEWDHDYTDCTGSGKLTFEYSKDYLKYFYKGVRLLVKQYWNYPSTYQTLEDARLKVKETSLAEEKTKLKKIIARIKKDNVDVSKTNDTSTSTKLTGTGKTSTSKNSATDTTLTTTKSEDSTTSTNKTSTDTSKTKTTTTTTEINIPENPTTANDSLLGFITDSSISNDGIEVTLSDYGKMLEEKKELTYTQKKRSEIVENVIANAGLIPVVDFTGLTDDVIDWTSVTATGNNGGGTVGEASTSYTQCSRTYDLAGSLVSSGSVPTLSSGDERIKTIGKSGTNYASACSGKSIQEVMSILRNGWHYHYYSDNRDNCATDSWNNKVSKGLNCGDSSRLLKCCMDVAGHPCICVHTSGHYYNAVQVNGQWLTVDLCHSSDIKSKSGTNKLGY